MAIGYKRLLKLDERYRKLQQEIIEIGSQVIPLHDNRYSKETVLNNWTAREVIIWKNRHMDANGKYTRVEITHA